MGDNRSKANSAIEIFECSACGSDPGRPSCRRPGGSLEGRIVISSESKLQFESMEVLLQGLESANFPVYGWEYDQIDDIIEHRPSSNMTMVKSRDMFLNITHRISLESIKRDDENGSRKYSGPFSFIIPSIFAQSQYNKPLMCCALPPSFDTSMAGPIPWHQVPPSRLSIAYRLHARVHYREVDNTETRYMEAIKPINIIAEPPAYAEEFPGNFLLTGRATLYKHALGGRLASIIVCASEPPPLIQLSSTLPTSTQSTVTLTVNPVSMSQTSLQKLSFDIRPAIREKNVLLGQADAMHAQRDGSDGERPHTPL